MAGGYVLLPQQQQHQDAINGSPGTGLIQAKAAQATLPPGIRSVATAKRSQGGRCFLLVVYTVVAALYSSWLFILFLPLTLQSEPNWSFLAGYFAVFNVVFGLFLIALIQAIRTDPGGVPAHWGFYVGDDARRRRYCRICNVWKPDRTHHCSTCGKCALNMDHHCPWINNCVGFYNRKFFIQTLYYALATLIMLLVHGVYFLIYEAQRFWPSSDYSDVAVYDTFLPSDYISWTAIVFTQVISALLVAALIPFSRFHWQLLINNSTTIESMDPQFQDHASYDLGSRRNIEQVFGPSILLWWIPFHLYSSRPVGDGVRWRKPYFRNDAAETV